MRPDSALRIVTKIEHKSFVGVDGGHPSTAGNSIVRTSSQRGVCLVQNAVLDILNPGTPASLPRGAVMPCPEHWRESVVYSECSLHQIAPFIGKLKSSIARSLIETYTEKGQTIYDPF